MAFYTSCSTTIEQHNNGWSYCSGSLFYLSEPELVALLEASGSITTETVEPMAVNVTVSPLPDLSIQDANSIGMSFLGVMAICFAFKQLRRLSP